MSDNARGNMFAWGIVLAFIGAVAVLMRGEGWAVAHLRPVWPLWCYPAALGIFGCALIAIALWAPKSRRPDPY